MFKDILQDLYILEDPSMEVYPSPEELKGKFIIKERNDRFDMNSELNGRVTTEFHKGMYNIILLYITIYHCIFLKEFN